MDAEAKILAEIDRRVQKTFTVAGDWSVMKVITKVMELIEDVMAMDDGKKKKLYAIKAIENIAYGRDGLPGTVDDRLPLEVVNGLRLMIESDILPNTIDVIAGVAKGHFDINKTASLLKNCFMSMGSCFPLCCPGCFKKEPVVVAPAAPVEIAMVPVTSAPVASVVSVAPAPPSQAVSPATVPAVEAIDPFVATSFPANANSFKPLTPPDMTAPQTPRVCERCQSHI